MKALKTSPFVSLSALLLVVALSGQSPLSVEQQGARREAMANLSTLPGAPQHARARIPKAFQGLRILPSGPLRFLASGEGRGFLEATHHPLAPYLARAFGGNAQDPIPPASENHLAAANAAREFATAPAPATVPCAGNGGVRFNLEPRANAVPQSQEMADFIPSGVAPGDDLIVQVADDFRGNIASDTHWDQSVSGYYVHRSTTADCSVQFEGGLPSFQFQGDTIMGIGDTVVAADPMRNAVFVADLRFGNAAGVGLFRASASTLLNPSRCPNGTHLQAQAASCWEVTPPALVFGEDVADFFGGQPRIVVDERPTSAGTGAGDVYVVQSTSATQATGIFLAACTNTLTCGAGAALSGTDVNSGFPYVQVRPDGLITISYTEMSSKSSSETINFVTCTPAGAPQQPVCGAPTTVVNVAEPLGAFLGGGVVANEPVNLNLNSVSTYPKHADRQEPAGKFTIFLIYDDCKDVFKPGNGGTPVCVAAEVLMTFSTDNGKTWSTPVAVDPAGGHHFFPAISTDASTGTVSLIHYATDTDKFKHEVNVILNQIAPGSTALSAPKLLTKRLDIDDDPGNQGFFLFSTFIGASTRGNGTPGQSQLYASFDSTAANGTYSGRSLPESNNHLILVGF